MRMTRSSVLVQRGEEYVVAARALGASDVRLLARHVMPNILPPLLVQTVVPQLVIVALHSVLVALPLRLKASVASV